jgi:EmrB/QacA subfamily drug resistance transporter
VNQGAHAPDPRRWWALALLGTAFFMVILDGTIVYVALPSIQKALDFSDAALQWVMSTYLVCFGGLLLLGGRAADLLGRRRVFMVGVGLFVFSSLLCGLAWSPAALIGARVVQGISAAIMAPTALSLLMTVFPEGAERNKALGIWGGIGGIGATAGLLIGGLITETLGWEWVFFINVPVGLAVLVFSTRLLRESIDTSCARCFDIAGAVTVTGALLLFVYAIGLLSVSVTLLVLFGRIEARSRAPLVPLRLFRSRSLIGGNLVLLAAGMSIDGMLLIVTLYAQDVLGYSTIQFGLMTAVMTVLSVAGAYTAQAVVSRVGARPVAVIGTVFVGTGCLLLTQVSVDGSYFDDLFLGLLIFGAGLGAVFVASQIAALSGVAEQESGLAAGLVDSSFNIGGALGIAILSSIAFSSADNVLKGSSESAHLQTMTEGFQTALAVAIGFALLGLCAAVTFLGRPAPEAAPISAVPSNESESVD